MGQNQSFPDGSSAANPGEPENGSSGSQKSAASETSEDSSMRDSADKRLGAVSQAQSIRAAIDTLIESCLVAKDDGMNGETVKAPAVSYSLEQLTNLKDESGNSETSSRQDKKESSAKKEATDSRDGHKDAKDREIDDSSPKTFGSLMEKSIIELIKKGDDEHEELTMIGTAGQGQKSAGQGEKSAEVSAKHIGSGCDRTNPSEQTKSAAADKSASKPGPANSPRTLAQPKRTVRLQTLIDTVLDNSLAHEMPSAFEKRKSEALINDLLVNRPDSSSKNVNPTKLPAAPSVKTTAASDVKENKMVYLMDHIEKVLERNLEASYDDSDDESNLQILHRLSWESPPTSTSAPTQNTESRTKQSDLQSRSSSGSNSSEGTISVQDIVDRVISQTEVISKLLSPSDSASGARAAKHESGKNNTTSASSTQLVSSHVNSKMEKPRSPQSRPSSVSHSLEGHSAKVSEYNSRGRPRASTYDSIQMWNLRHAQESRSAVNRSLEKNAQEYRQLDATPSSEGMHSLSKNGKPVPSPSFGTGPLVMPPYGNSLAPTAGIISFAQSPVFRPPGQMFVPRYPVPLLRVEMSPDGPHGLPPHPPSASCACGACFSKFHMEEHSAKHGMLGPISPSSGMLSPHGPVESSYYQQRLASQLHSSGPGQPNSFIMREYGQPRSNSPGRHPIPSAPQMPSVVNKQGVGQTQKTLHYPPAVPLGGFPRDAEFRGYSSYEKQKLDLLKTERGYQMQQISVQNPFETPRTDVPYSNVDPNFFARRLEPSLHRNEDHGRGGSYENVADRRLQPLPPRPSPPQAAAVEDSRRERMHVSSQILDLTVKNYETKAQAQRSPSRPEAADEVSDEPLDLSKKSSSQGTFTGNHAKRQHIEMPKPEPVGFRKPDSGIKHEGNSKPPHEPHIDGNTGRYGHSQQNELHPYHHVGPSVFSMNSRVPGPAEMAPTVNPNMLISAGGQRPQLHPLPAPSLATSLMPSSSNTMLQTYITHAATAAALPNHAVDQRDKLPIPGHQSHQAKTTEPLLKPQSESPQLDSADMEKGDVTMRRNSNGRNEPIQSIIGNHNPNDILYLICRICRQSNGSPYAFRKHFRNHHGFEPKAEHTIVQTISATKSARQNPYAANGPDGSCGQFGASETVQDREEQGAMERLESHPKESYGTSESPSKDSPTQNEVSNKPKSYGRSVDGKPSGAKDNREDTKYLECPECKQTFQLNDFGSYKRHCRQHNQSRGSGSFVTPEMSDSQEAMDKIQGGITMCKICGVPFSVHFIEDHIRSVHGYFCSQCPDVFKTSEDLHGHVRSAHPGHFLPAASPGLPAASPGTRLSPRIHSPSRASNSSSLSNSPHHRSPSRSGIAMATPSPGSGSQKSSRDVQSSPGELVMCIPTSKSSPVPVSRVPASESTNYGPISSTCEIERVPADNLTISASPDSSSDNVNKCCVSVSTVSDITVSCSLTSHESSEDRNKVVSTVKNKTKGDDDMDSTVSGSPSSDMIMDAPPISDGDGHTQNFFYKHKKFGGHRKRAESFDACEVSAKVARQGKGDSSSSSGHNVNEDSSSSSCSSCKSNDGDKTDERVAAKDQTGAVLTKPKVENKIKQEARHQLPFVWDRVTRIQAGKNIKPPDYMT